MFSENEHLPLQVSLFCEFPVFYFLIFFAFLWLVGFFLKYLGKSFVCCL